MGLLSGIVRAAGALVGNYLGGPAGAAIGGGLATKLTGGSTKSALATGAISGLGAWGMQSLTGGPGDGVPEFDRGDMTTSGYEAPEVYGPPEAPKPSFMERAGNFVGENKSNLARLGLGGLVAAGALSSGNSQPRDNYIENPVGMDPVIRARPMSRQRRMYQDDPRRYGETGGEWMNYERVNPEVQTYRRGGRVRGIACFADGGRAYQPYSGNPYSYGGGGEHLWFSGQPTTNSVPGSAPVMAPPNPEEGMFRYTPWGERIGGEGGGGYGSSTGREAGVARGGDLGKEPTATSWGDMLSKSLSGLQAFSPIGLPASLATAKEGKLGNIGDVLSAAFDAITGFGQNQAPVESGKQGMQSANDANANGEAATSGDSAMGGHGGQGGEGHGGSDPDGNGNWRKGGSVRGLGALTAPSPAARAGVMRGPGGGQDDLIEARVADGEHIFDSATVADIGDGSNDEGHRRLEAMKRNIRAHKRSAPAGKIPPKAKGLGAYMKKAA